MVKKATIDILEIITEENSESNIQTDIIKEEAGAVEKGASGFFSMVKQWVHKPLFQIIFISVVLFGSIISGFVHYFHGKVAKAPLMQQKTAVSGSQVLATEKMISFDGFVVDQVDEKGNIRIAFCDIVLQLEKLQTAAAIDGDRVDVRNVVYTVLKREAAKDSMATEGRAHLKEVLKSELNLLFRENLVKNIYFTRYELD